LRPHDNTTGQQPTRLLEGSTKFDGMRDSQVLGAKS
jgi:hypothetical protein